MAVPPPFIPPPPGWSRDGNNGFFRSSHQPVPGKNWTQYSVNPFTGERIVYAIGPQISTGLVNQVTGQSFDIGGTRREIMSINSNGQVTKLNNYNDAVKIYGPQGLETIKADSRNAATTLMTKTNVTPESVKASPEYKAPLQNAAKKDDKSEITSSTSQEQLLSNKSIQGASPLKKFDGAGGSAPLSYPITRDPKQDYIKFLMYEYSPKKFLGSEGVGFGDRMSSRSSDQSIIGSVTLPIQPTITDNNIVNWQEDTLNWQESMLGKVSLGAILGGPEGGANAANQATEDMQQNSGAYKSAAAGTLAAAAVGSNKSFLTRTTGAIINPNAELLFQGPGIRTFTFTFTLSAREDKEAVVIRKIIRFFKEGMAAKRAKSNLFLKSPNTFGIKYMYGPGGEHPWINKIKECALQNFSVNYTPLGNYATYPDGAMVSYDLTMNFSELDPLYDDDYKDSNTIGY
jgi:hypothetical protein